MSTLNIPLFVEDRKDTLKEFQFASRPGAMINPQWLELPVSRTNSHGPYNAFSHLRYIDACQTPFLDRGVSPADQYVNCRIHASKALFSNGSVQFNTKHAA